MPGPDCYQCRHRREIPGDAHSLCAHPSITVPVLAFAALAHNLPGPARELSVSGDPHGIRKGWFAWPINFDPVWLRSCSGFQRKE